MNSVSLTHRFYIEMLSHKVKLWSVPVGSHAKWRTEHIHVSEIGPEEFYKMQEEIKRRKIKEGNE